MFSVKVPWQVWAGAAAVAGLLAVDHFAYKRGFSAADAQWVALVEQETGRQIAANENALEWARNEVARLQKVKEERDALIEELDAAAAADPDAGNVCLSPDSVRRLNLGDE